MKNAREDTILEVTGQFVDNRFLYIDLCHLTLVFDCQYRYSEAKRSQTQNLVDSTALVYNDEQERIDRDAYFE